MKKTFKQFISDYLIGLCSELRSVIEHRKQKPRTPMLNKLGKLFLILWCIVFLIISCSSCVVASAEDDTHLGEPIIFSAPTDLTGYTVTVPAGWTATAGYGLFSLNGHIVSPEAYVDTLGPLGIGYSFDPMSLLLEPYSNSIALNSYPVFVYPDSSFSLLITGGSDASNPNFIQWLVDNNATFVNKNEPDEPISVTVSAGLYYLQNTYNDLRGTINFSVPFISKSTYFNAITFAGIDNEQYVSINYAGNNVLPNVYNGIDGWSFAEYSVIYVQSDIELSEAEYVLFERAFVSFADNPKLDILFQAGQENGQSVGYSQGFYEGRTEGYIDGFANGRAEGIADGFMGDFFGGIVQALDALKLFGDFSVLNIIEGVLGLMLALWILKLIAGG